jgi:ryanodine receptor 2
MSTYSPEPIDTTGIALTDGQVALVETLAAHVHDVWAAQRIADGWRFGRTRDDISKSHPCLVPYDELPESEKTYDRVMVEQVIKAAVALGYRIDR